MKLGTPQKRLGARSFFSCVIAVYLIQILAIDMYAPALPTMQQSFGVSELYLNNTVFSFLFTSTVAMVLSGPLSDRFGRKPVFLAGCVLFTAGSLACAVAPGVDALTAARAVEAVGAGTTATISAALIQDSYEGADLKLAMTLLESLIIVGPVLAPFLGSFVIEAVGWRGIFWGLSAGGAVTVALACLISETYDAAANAGKGLGESLRTMLLDAKSLLSQKSFAAMALFIGVTGVPFFAFIAVSSYILLDDFQMSYLGYSFIYAGACAANMVAPFVYLRLTRRWGTSRIMRFVICLVAVSAVSLIAYGRMSPVLLLVAFVPYALAEGIARPAAYLVMLDQPPRIVGSASALGNFTYGVVTALASVAAALPWPSFALGLAVLMLASCALAFVLYLVGHEGWE